MNKKDEYILKLLRLFDTYIKNRGYKGSLYKCEDLSSNSQTYIKTRHGYVRM